MENFVKWNLTYFTVEGREHISFNCNRCGTKNTHGIIQALFKTESNHEEGQLYTEEAFKIIQCSTCGAIITMYELSEPKDVKQKQTGKFPPEWEFKLSVTKRLLYPIHLESQEFPEEIKNDYNLMHGCFQIGSSEGIAVHCLKILDNIFRAFEKKYLRSSEINVKDKLEVRAEKISEKCVYFKHLNENIKSLKGMVSEIIHGNLDEIVKEKLIIVEKDFKILNDIIKALSELYDLEFNKLPNIKSGGNKE